MGPPRIPLLREVLHSWLLLRNHQWPRRYHTSRWFRSSLYCYSGRSHDNDLLLRKSPEKEKSPLLQPQPPDHQLTTSLSQFTNKYKYLLSIDEGLDIFAIHGVGGFVGDILTGFFAAKFVPALDGVSGDSYDGGWWDHNWIQMGYQLAAAVTCAAWSFVVTCILLFIINKIPGCHIRESEEDEMKGLDFKYLHDVDEEMESRLFGGAGAGGVGHITGRELEAGNQGVGQTGVLSGSGEGGSEPSSVKEKDRDTVLPTKRD